MFFVVVENPLDALNAGILHVDIIPLVDGLVPVEDAADEGRDKKRAGFGGRYGLHIVEHQRHVTVDAMLRAEDVGGLDALPGRSYLDENSALVDIVLLIDLRKQVRIRRSSLRKDRGISGGQKNS